MQHARQRVFGADLTCHVAVGCRDLEAQGFQAAASQHWSRCKGDLCVLPSCRYLSEAAFLFTSQAPPPPCYGTMAGPLRLYPLHDPRLATPLRNVRKRVAKPSVRPTVSKGAVNFFTGAYKLLDDGPSSSTRVAHTSLLS